ncbi:hypothetical protein DWQ65_11970 [Treponema phagedenis]|uniref:CpXC domain-containing protein n=1 Tax=Treponema phagedenis TaxID=162 RepID=A0A0B7GRJ7_TREPH|nr:CpXC domain-containing protein [Treponema phagedenis]EFW39231.1 hypothetical protein HMPREF9554_00265 [Treponema phagedenis F0421]NVP23561.1 hypothetical protein [Treponema phagedenis]QEJ94558.1 hypothetical protein FUT79_04635 [Treponema phagedenis]QEJ98695.1 hypothetical protein FUT82_12245 [Treponema phagedenis]QEK01564.1 hypothetical protein FUT84_10610 [Treponema phagedenis]
MKIKCKCDYSFEIEYKKTLSLDDNPQLIDDIINGKFLSFICPSCRSKINMELKTEFIWKAKKTKLLFAPEQDRIECLSSCAGEKMIDSKTDKEIENTYVKKDQTPVIGYPELVDRLSALRNNLNPETIEAVKFFILEGAKNLDVKKASIYFEKILPDEKLEFHVHGIKKDETAIMPIPKTLYTQIEKDKKKHTEIFAALYLGSYLSYKNIFIGEK